MTSNDGKGFAVFRLSCSVQQLWLHHVHDHRVPYSEFYRTLQRYLNAKRALAELIGEYT